VARFVSNVRISSPVAIDAKPDVDLNGVMFSYTVGLMYPSTAAVANSTMRQPTAPTLTSLGALGRSKQ
jgi:hypothetical protein